MMYAGTCSGCDTLFALDYEPTFGDTWVCPVCKAELQSRQHPDDVPPTIYVLHVRKPDA